MAKKFLLGIVAAAVMIGCVKRKDVEPEAVVLGSATISGFVKVSTEHSADTLNQSLGFDEKRSWEYDQLGNITIKLTYSAGAGDPNYTGPGGTTKIVTTGVSTTTGAWSAVVETPEVGNHTVTWSIDATPYFDVSDSLNQGAGLIANYATERLAFGIQSGPNGSNNTGTVVVRAGEVVKLADFVYKD